MLYSMAFQKISYSRLCDKTHRKNARKRIFRWFWGMIYSNESLDSWALFSVLGWKHFLPDKTPNILCIQWLWEDKLFEIVCDKLAWKNTRNTFLGGFEAWFLEVCLYIQSNELFTTIILSKWPNFDLSESVIYIIKWVYNQNFNGVVSEYIVLFFIIEVLEYIFQIPSNKIGSFSLKNIF